MTGAGATFAVWVNVIYLLPLTYLFVSFFIASYVRRSNRAIQHKKSDQEGSRQKSTVEIAERASRDAARDLEREVYRETGSPALTDSDSDASKKAAKKTPVRSRSRKA